MNQLDRENTVISLVHPHLTFASQQEFQVDRIHGEFGTINPHIAHRTGGLEYWKERFLYVTYGDAYRHMMNGDYS